MRKYLFSLVLFAFNNIYGQITTTKIVEKSDAQLNKNYDSTLNFLSKDVYKYVGQELYLNQKSKELRKFGYADFYVRIAKYKYENAVYKCCESFNSIYDSIAGKYFKVLEVTKHPQASEMEFLYGDKYFLKLEEKQSKDIVYYEYDAKYDHSFPFIVVGYFEKIKKASIGKEIIFQDPFITGSTDITSGSEISVITGEKWTCTDLTIEDKYYNISLIFENIKRQKIALEYEYVLGKYGGLNSFTVREADAYKKKFGIIYWTYILRGKVKLGMTKEMCLLSWGEPKSKNETITSRNHSEQWVYENNYLYFDKGILTAIQ